MANRDIVRGRIKEATGALTDDDQLKRQGRMDQTAGKVKDGVERAVDRVRDTLQDADSSSERR